MKLSLHSFTDGDRRQHHTAHLTDDRTWPLCCCQAYGSQEYKKRCHMTKYDVLHWLVKGKEYHTPWRVLVGCSSPLLRPWAHRWIHHLSLWRIASVTPDLRLPSQSQDISAPRLVPNNTAWWQRHMCGNNLPKVVTWQRLGQELNSWSSC